MNKRQAFGNDLVYMASDHVCHGSFHSHMRLLHISRFVHLLYLMIERDTRYKKWPRTVVVHIRDESNMGVQLS